MISQNESQKTLNGRIQSTTAHNGKLARRFVEAGVRYSRWVYSVPIGRDSWDDHGNFQGGGTGAQTDEVLLHSIDAPITIRNFHATILNLMGLKNEELRFLHAGHMRQLTDIGGSVLDDLTG